MWQPYSMQLVSDMHTIRVRPGSHSQCQQVMKISQNEYLTKPCFRKIHKSFKFHFEFQNTLSSQVVSVTILTPLVLEH